MNGSTLLIWASTLLLSAISFGAHAQGSDVLGSYGGVQDHDRFRTDQEFMFELRVQQYIPDVDGEFDLPEGVVGPYEYVFGVSNSIGRSFEFPSLEPSDPPTVSPTPSLPPRLDFSGIPRGRVRVRKPRSRFSPCMWWLCSAPTSFGTSLGSR